MIEDTLKNNPGMRETYSAYVRVDRAFDAIIDVDAKFETSADSNSSVSEGRLIQLHERLEAARAHLRQCLENEKTLRVQAGFPPLEEKVLQSAEAFLKKHEYVLNEKCSLIGH